MARGQQEERFTTQGKVIAESLKARRIKFDDLDEPVWVPTSQLELDELPEAGNTGVINMTAWIAKKIGLL